MSDAGTDSAAATTRPSEQAQDLRTLLDLLDLERIDDDAFVGRHPTGRGIGSRTFGGQLVAQSTIAAGRTVDGDRAPHHVSVQFVRGGDPKHPIEYRVDRLRDGRALANRQVTALQDGQELCVALIGFQDSGRGLEHAVPGPDVPHPDDLPTLGDRLAGYEDALPHFVAALRPIDMRYANDPSWILKGTGETLGHNRVWMRTDGPLSDDPLLHAALLGYGSDTTVLDSIITTHGLSWGLDRIVAATVNHSIWLHRPLRFDEWVLYATESPVAAGSRGLATGRFYSQRGDLLATVVQEGMIRHFPKRG